MSTLYGPLVAQVVKALGLPKNTRSFVLRASVDEVMTIECEYFPDEIDVDALPTLAVFELEKRETGCTE